MKGSSAGMMYMYIIYIYISAGMLYMYIIYIYIREQI
jgi:hypothetical protein